MERGMRYVTKSKPSRACGGVASTLGTGRTAGLLFRSRHRQEPTNETPQG